VFYTNAIDKNKVTTMLEAENVTEEDSEDSYPEESTFIDANCKDFAAQSEVQDFYKTNGGPYEDPYDLDRDNKRMACDWN
jgi:hypothetical protein